MAVSRKRKNAKHKTPMKSNLNVVKVVLKKYLRDKDVENWLLDIFLDIDDPVKKAFDIAFSENNISKDCSDEDKIYVYINMCNQIITTIGRSLNKVKAQAIPLVVKRYLELPTPANMIKKVNRANVDIIINYCYDIISNILDNISKLLMDCYIDEAISETYVRLMSKKLPMNIDKTKLVKYSLDYIMTEDDNDENYDETSLEVFYDKSLNYMCLVDLVLQTLLDYKDRDLGETTDRLMVSDLIHEHLNVFTDRFPSFINVSDTDLKSIEEPNTKEILEEDLEIEKTLQESRTTYISSYKQLNKIAEDNGFVYTRSNGDHGIFINNEGEMVVIPQGRDVGKGLSIKIQKIIRGE